MKNTITFINFVLISFIFNLSSLVLVTPAFAQITPAPTGTSLGNLEGLGPLGTIINRVTSSNVSPASNILANTLSMVIGLLTLVAGIWFIIQFLIAGLNWISSSGDKNKAQDAQKRITNAVIGITVVVAAYAVTSLIGKILGIPNILNLGALINLIGPR